MNRRASDIDLSDIEDDLAGEEPAATTTEERSSRCA